MNYHTYIAILTPSVGRLVEEVDRHVEALNQVASLYSRDKQFGQCLVKDLFRETIKSLLVDFELHIEDSCALVRHSEYCWLAEECHAIEDLMLHTLKRVVVCLARLHRLDEDELKISVDAAQIFEGKFELLYVDPSFRYKWDFLSLDAMLCEFIQSLEAGKGWVLQFATEDDFHLSIYTYFSAFDISILIDSLLYPLWLHLVLFRNQVQKQVSDQIAFLLRELDRGFYDN